jgi:predicted AlkP superfamily pyrophosphatase or phosphodiesterase
MGWPSALAFGMRKATPRSTARLAPLLGALLFCVGGVVPAARAQRSVPLRPSLVVFITIDQMIPDYFARYGAQFRGGLRRLQSGGVLFTNGFHDHATTETAPGHAATMSGRFPMHTGIVRNNAGVNDGNHPVLGRGAPGASPFRFVGTTLTDWLIAADPRSRALSISRKDRGAILPIGRSKQAVFWYAGDSGRFSTSTWYGDTLPTWLTRFNARRLPQRTAGTTWTLLRDPAMYAERDSVPIESGGRGFMFPHALPTDSLLAARALPEDPRMDWVTLQAAMAGVDAMALGKGPSTDVLAISLSTTDAVGHRYGPDSREIHDQVLRLDAYLGEFLDSLYRIRDSSRVVIALTADHGVQPYPELHFAGQNTALRVNAEPVLTQTRRGLAARGLDTALAIDFEYGMVFADSMAFKRANVSLDSVLRSMAAAFREVPGVARVDRVRDLAKADTVRDAIARRWIHAIPPSLPVVLLVTPKPFVYWQGVNYATHGSPNDADARVPILFYGPGFARGVRRTRTVRVVDMAPTLARRIGVTPAERLDGVVLTDAFRR